MRDPELAASGGKDLGAVSGAAIGEETLNANAMSGVKADRLAERVEGTGDLFIGKETGESEATVIIDGDVQGLDAGPGIALGAITGCADARTREAAQLLDVEVEELARKITFVALDRRPQRLERGDAMETVATQTRESVALETGSTSRI